MGLPGVFMARKKDHSVYYRSSITVREKHISLGSYPTELEAHLAYKEARMVCETAVSYTHLTLPTIGG